MAFRYVFGLPFLYVNGHVEDVMPLDYSVQPSRLYSLGETENILGMTQKEIVDALFGQTGTSTFWELYKSVGLNTNMYFSGDGSLGGNDYAWELQGALVDLADDMWYTTNGLQLKRKNVITNEYEWIIDFAAVTSTGIRYPNENNLAVSQYLTIGLVDAYNHISFACVSGCFANYYGPYPSTSKPALQSNSTITIASYVNINDIYTLLEDAPWSDVPEEGDDWDMSNRHMPLGMLEGFGIYELDVTKADDFSFNLWTPNFIQTITNTLGLTKEPSQMILSYKMYYGIADDISRKQTDEYIVLGSTAMDGTHSSIAVSAKALESEGITHDCGTLTVAQQANDYTDYMTDIRLYIPFYGFISLNPNDVMGGTVGLKYNIDLSTGCAQAMVIANNSRLNNAVVAQVQCNVSVSISTTHEAMADTEARAAMGLAGAVASYAASKNPVAAVAGGIGAALAPQNQIAGSGISPGYSHLGGLQPYMIISRVIKANPATSASAIGKKDGGVSSIGSHAGFVKVKGLTEASMSALNGCKCKDRIIQALKEGVYV